MRFKHTMKGPKTQEEWIEAYEERTGETVNFLPGEEAVYNEQYGFCTYIIDRQRKVLILRYMCGDSKFWGNYIYQAFKALKENHGFRCVETVTRRNPKAMVRISGGKHVRSETLHYIEIDIESMKGVHK